MSVFRGDTLVVPLGGMGWAEMGRLLRLPRLPRPDLAVLIAAAAVLMPLMPWMHWATGFGAQWAHRLGVPIVAQLTAYVAWPELLFWLTGLGAVGVWLAAPRPLARDPWLGAAIVLAAGARFFHGPLVDPEVVVLFVLGAILFTVIRSAPASARATACRALGAAGLLQASIVIQQARGVDLGQNILYSPTPLRMIGTFGNEGFAGGFIAFAGLLGAGWMLPVAAVAIWLTHSAAAMLAFGVGLAVRYQTRWALFGLGLLLVVLALTIADRMRTGTVNSANLRADVWLLAATDRCPGGPLALLIGCGLGSWSRRIPDLQTSTGVGFDVDPARAPVNPFGNWTMPVDSPHLSNLPVWKAPTPAESAARACCYWTTAHNDPLQWVYETGAAGLTALIGWFVAHRRMVMHAVAGGAVSALIVESLIWYPFHLYALALPALVILGCAAAPLTNREV